MALECGAGCMAFHLAVGILAASADYGAGVGFGLVATPLLVYLLGVDPRVAVASALGAQLASSPIALAAWSARGTGLPGLSLIVLLALSAVAGIMAGFMAVRGLSEASALTVYTVALAALALVYARGSRSQGRASSQLSKQVMVAALVAGGFLAGLGKAVAGGGFSPVVVAVQRLSGVRLEAALASLPIVKPPVFAAAALAYSAQGFMDLQATLALAVGACIGALAAPSIAGKLGEERIRALVLLVIAVSAVKGVYELAAALVLSGL
ncbi:MAG: sulfite exporter TauE/SafE family protein [Desulfurococcales archaeon]|nr:sulfite exporter TauE/SafE family protein [Desulfurococcales archaeon]